MSKEVSGVFDHKVVQNAKDRTYPSAFRNAIYKNIVGTEGVSNSIGNSLELIDISDGIDLKVKLLDGVAFVSGSSYRLYDDGTGNFKELAIDSEQAGLNRIDSIILEFSSLDNDRKVIAKVLKGASAVTPTPPSLIQSNVEDVKGIYQMEIHRLNITGGNQNAVVITDVRKIYNDLRSTFLSIVDIVSGNTVVGAAEYANKAGADENDRNFANHLQINTYTSLASIGLVDGDLVNGDEDASFKIIEAALPINSILRISVIEAGTSSNLVSLFPGNRGTFEMQKVNDISLDGVTMFFSERNDQPPINTTKLYYGSIGTVEFSGWLLVLDADGTATNSSKLNGLPSTEYAKRKTVSFVGQIVPTGYRQLIKFSATNGRGSWKVTIRNAGGTNQAKGTVLHIHTTSFTKTSDSNLLDSMTVISNSALTLWDKVRLMYDAGTSAKYLEFNVTAANLDNLIISCESLTDAEIDTFSNFQILNPVSDIGGVGAVINEEVDVAGIVFNIAEKLFVKNSGNSASGILLENFKPSGLQITSSDASVTVIHADAKLTKYTDFLLEVGATEQRTRYLIIPKDAIIGDRFFDVSENTSISDFISSKLKASFYLDLNDDLVGNFASIFNWTGASGSNGTNAPTTAVKVFRAWGIVR